MLSSLHRGGVRNFEKLQCRSLFSTTNYFHILAWGLGSFGYHQHLLISSSTTTASTSSSSPSFDEQQPAEDSTHFRSVSFFIFCLTWP